MKFAELVHIKQESSPEVEEKIEAIKEKIEKVSEEIREANLEQSEKFKNNVSQREEIIEDLTVEELLEKYGIDAEKVKIDFYSEDILNLKITNHFNKEKLPKGYRYKGGAARSLLLRNLGKDPESQPRDIDISRLVTTNSEKDAEIAKKYMPEDFENGYSVDEIETLEKYFKTRDFTINEVIATNDEIFMTKECLSDTLRNIIRLTDYEKKRYRGIASYKMLAKALRLYVLQIEKYGYSEIKNINNYQYENYFIDPFWLAIHLDRACQRSETVAIEYIKLLIQKGQMPQQIETIEDATEFLLDKMYDSTNFYFRYAPEKQFGIEEDLLKDSKISKLDKLPKFQSHHKPQK